MGDIQQISTEVANFNPYPGPRPFANEEAPLFFGRELETGELFSLISAHQVVLLYAQSGAGKSSLLNAGLIPLMAKEGFEIIRCNGFGGLNSKEVGLVNATNAFVFNSIVRWSDEKDVARLWTKSFADFLSEKEPSIGKRGVRAPRVILFDQFEGLFTNYMDRWQDRKDFFSQLSVALEKDPFLRVIFAMREDYIAQLDPYTSILPERLRTRLRLERLREDAALLAVTEPLRATRRHFNEGVAESLVENLLKERVESDVGAGIEIAEVTGEFVEPVQLQVVCKNIWNSLTSDVVTIDASHLTSVGNVDTALSDFYDAAIRAVIDTVFPFEKELRDWCQERLVTSVGTRNMIYRDPEYTSGLPNAAIDVLEGNYLIRAERRAGGRWYELTHDRFIKPIQISNNAYLKRIEKDSEEALLATSDGDEKLQRKKYEAAIESYQRALAIYRRIGLRSGEAIILRQLGSMSALIGNYHEAIIHFDAALQISLDMQDLRWASDVILKTSAICFDMEEFEQAANLAAQAIEMVPNGADGYQARANAYWYGERFKEAVADYSKVLELLPRMDARWALNGRGHALAEMGEYESAVSDLLLAIELMEGAGESTAYPLNGLGLAYAGLRRYEEAFKTFNESISKSPDNGWVYYNRAKAYLFMENKEKATEDFKMAIEKNDPKLTPVKVERAKRFLQTQSLED